MLGEVRRGEEACPRVPIVPGAAEDGVVGLVADRTGEDIVECKTNSLLLDR